MLAAFERQQRDAADAAARQGRWVDAIWAWDIVLALRPRDADAARRRAQAVAAINAALPERLARARAARSRGDIDAAARAYLDVLVLAPDHAAAADALREIERERVRRYQLGQPSRAVMARRAPANASARSATVEERTEIEHASMLASQGDLKSAIAILQPLAGPRRGSATLRALLADLYLLQAEQLAAHRPCRRDRRAGTQPASRSEPAAGRAAAAPVARGARVGGRASGGRRAVALSQVERPSRTFFSRSFSSMRRCRSSLAVPLLGSSSSTRSQFAMQPSRSCLAHCGARGA